MHKFPANLTWRVSSWSAGGNCIEVASTKIAVFVRDTKRRNRATLLFPTSAWEEFTRAVRTDSITFK